MMHVIVDPDLCVSSESCVTLHPEAFRIGDDEVAETLPGEQRLTDEQRQIVVESCPVAALRLG
jgi:ferredoxin